MNWRQKIVADWPNEPQKAAKARMALQQIEEGLAMLATLGHPLHVEEGYLPPPKPEYPKVLFHIFQGQRVVHNVGDEKELGDDWYPTMEEARHAAGMTKQNQRGGIFARALPSIFRRTPEEETQVEMMNRTAREAHRKFVLDQRAIHRHRADVSEAKRNGRSLE